ncbi:MAG: hypothetical protein J6U84_04265 [Bacteroidales bacterium]|nr:hypothetical protein [Bacteroidales bacterium]
MRKVLLSLAIVSLLASCGGETATPTEIVTETPAVEVEEVSQTETTETSQLMDINEITYFDDVFNCTDCRGYLFLAKDMTWYDLSGGSSLFLSYGRYSISNGVVTLSTEYSDSGQYGNRMYNITYKDSELFLIDEDMEYKIDYKANKEELFGNVIELRRNNKGTQQENTNDYSWMHGEWRISYSVNDPWVGILHVNAVLIIDTDNKTMTSIDPDRGIIDCSGKYTINKNNNTISADGMYVNFDSSRRQFYSKANGSIYYYNKVK